ncbi:ABC transporter permease [Bermanella marisrubri]|uniref:ABC-type nitrate/sulfonate/bicarbonate transport system, permease component n=1 Tax=Bermanella marisrubri TaxID=207949 RepID=Q1N0E5_9GAMM|nr:ABC transporter permease [Bermanella marisrubri]EAT11719.1 ABC-type nitrate/sulfonate/bicarbonate transport system, permease component [Oceanobacter sp. RED65] [Bermanella marisrubri]QIZ83246.1 ABC transporter permease [Bermanella marisrubri]
MTSMIARSRWLMPWIKLFQGQDIKQQSNILLKSLGIPFLAFIIFLFLWDVAAKSVVTSLGQVPGPAQVWQQAGGLWQIYEDEKTKEKAFYQRQNERNEARMAKDPNYEPRVREYRGRVTFIDQIITSLYTVFTGFLLAVSIAIPLGIATGLSKTLNTALNPIIQIFKPVSPLAWLPIVTMVVSAVYVSDDPWFEKSFVTSAITVTLCCLWPTLINTAVGVANISEDLINVSKVLRLNWFTKVRKVVLPSALPMMFTGMRLSLGVGWMVLIAAEMLAQNPGLGKFVWDEFQNGSSDSLGRIMVAVITIGFIGFILDSLMLMLQRWVSWEQADK